jgi:hypothetical protein
MEHSHISFLYTSSSLRTGQEHILYEEKRREEDINYSVHIINNNKPHLCFSDIQALGRYRRHEIHSTELFAAISPHEWKSSVCRGLVLGEGAACSSLDAGLEETSIRQGGAPSSSNYSWDTPCTLSSYVNTHIAHVDTHLDRGAALQDHDTALPDSVIKRITTKYITTKHITTKCITTKRLKDRM